jgi:hypothetical protein
MPSAGHTVARRRLPWVFGLAGAELLVGVGWISGWPERRWFENRVPSPRQGSVRTVQNLGRSQEGSMGPCCC